MDKVLNVLIIGNGFDLNHGLRTHYNDFKDYLLANKREHILHYLKPDDDMLWGNFEEYLKTIDLDDIKEEYAPEITAEDEAKDKDISLLSNSDSNMHYAISELKKEIQNEMNDWILYASKNIGSIKPKEHFKDIISSADLIITFNYSRTLETVYSVASSKVLHIHGLARERRLIRDYSEPDFCKKEDSEIIVGHSGIATGSIHQPKTVANRMLFCNEMVDFFFSENQESVMAKETSGPLEVLENRLCGYKIARLDIIGHSLSDPDKKYFECLNRSAGQGACCRLWCYQKFDTSKFNTLVNLVSDYSGICQKVYS